MKHDSLSDGEPPVARDGCVDSRVGLVGLGDCLQHFGCEVRPVGIDIHDHAAQVACRHADGGRVVRCAEPEHAAHPLVLLEGHGPRGSDDDVGTKPPEVRVLPCQAADLAHGVGGDHGDQRLVEDAMPHVHHLHGGAQAASDLRGQAITERRHRIALRCQHVSRQPFSVCAIARLRSEKHELRQLARRQPRKTAPFFPPAKREAPIALDAVPAERGGVERLAAHGLHRIAEDRFDLTDLDRHFVLQGRPRTSRASYRSAVRGHRSSRRRAPANKCIDNHRRG